MFKLVKYNDNEREGGGEHNKKKVWKKARKKGKKGHGDHDDAR